MYTMSTQETYSRVALALEKLQELGAMLNRIHLIESAEKNAVDSNECEIFLGDLSYRIVLETYKGCIKALWQLKENNSVFLFLGMVLRDRGLRRTWTKSGSDKLIITLLDSFLLLCMYSADGELYEILLKWWNGSQDIFNSYLSGSLQIDNDSFQERKVDVKVSAEYEDNPGTVFSGSTMPPSLKPHESNLNTTPREAPLRGKSYEINYHASTLVEIPGKTISKPASDEPTKFAPASRLKNHKFDGPPDCIDEDGIFNSGGVDKSPEKVVYDGYFISKNIIQDTNLPEVLPSYPTVDISPVPHIAPPLLQDSCRLCSQAPLNVNEEGFFFNRMEHENCDAIPPLSLINERLRSSKIRVLLFQATLTSHFLKGLLPVCLWVYLSRSLLLPKHLHMCHSLLNSTISRFSTKAPSNDKEGEEESLLKSWSSLRGYLYPTEKDFEAIDNTSSIRIYLTKIVEDCCLNLPKEEDTEEDFMLGDLLNAEFNSMTIPNIFSTSNPWFSIPAVKNSIMSSAKYLTSLNLGKIENLFNPEMNNMLGGYNKNFMQSKLQGSSSRENITKSLLSPSAFTLHSHESRKIMEKLWTFIDEKRKGKNNGEEKLISTPVHKKSTTALTGTQHKKKNEPSIPAAIKVEYSTRKDISENQWQAFKREKSKSCSIGAGEHSENLGNQYSPVVTPISATMIPELLKVFADFLNDFFVFGRIYLKFFDEGGEGVQGFPYPPPHSPRHYCGYFTFDHREKFLKYIAQSIGMLAAFIQGTAGAFMMRGIHPSILFDLKTQPINLLADKKPVPICKKSQSSYCSYFVREREANSDKEYPAEERAQATNSAVPREMGMVDKEHFTEQGTTQALNSEAHVENFSDNCQSPPLKLASDDKTQIPEKLPDATDIDVNPRNTGMTRILLDERLAMQICRVIWLAYARLDNQVNSEFTAMHRLRSLDLDGKAEKRSRSRVAQAVTQKSLGLNEGNVDDIASLLLPLQQEAAARRYSSRSDSKKNSESASGAVSPKSDRNSYPPIVKSAILQRFQFLFDEEGGRMQMDELPDPKFAIELENVLDSLEFTLMSVLYRSELECLPRTVWCCKSVQSFIDNCKISNAHTNWMDVT